MLRESFEKFVTERKYIKNVTGNTVDWYWCAWKAWGGVLVEPVTEERVKEVILALRRSGLSPISTNSYLRVLNAYLRWAGSPVKAPRQIEPIKDPWVMTEEQVRTLAKSVPQGTNEHRVRTLALLAIDSGLRISELLNLRRQDVDLDNLLLRVKEGKGRKDRIVPISIEGRKVLYRMLASQPVSGPSLVFATRTGGTCGYRNMLRDFAQFSQRLGLTGTRFSFHTLRHTFATNYIRRGGNVFMLQRILGHRTLAMTMRYVHLQTEDLSAVHSGLTLLTDR